MGVRLPPEYQEVEYLESTGVQYIDTALIPHENLPFDCVFNVASTAGAGFGNVFGSRIGASSGEYQLSLYQGGFVSAGNRQYTRIPAAQINRVSFDGETMVTVNGEDMALAFNQSSLQTTSRRIALFGINSNGIYTQLQALKLYYCRFGNEREFIPCYRKADSKPGVYDLVSGEFFVNQGTGNDFTVGPDVIDSISPWLVARRMVLMKEPELYPVGTNIRSLYNAVFISAHGIDTNTGEYVENSSRQASPVYMPISPKYTYWKRGTFPNRAYLSVLAFYDKDKNYISYYGKNDYGDFVIPDIPANARYARIAIPSGSYNDVKIIRTA